ncbi:Acylphosphatase [Trichodelitschia bisporula]|uniref:Acylphosphatase n=1 Tax=Trichodelitschia bisporula TaxID=703511 RepID=A0A6G1I234_9PEZI|nr:Acylphosphatase [Trichodelitschia bisporula]
MLKRISFKVEGRVQGVFFRDTTVRNAQTNGLTGWVRNESDGSVAGEAQGPPPKLDAFVEYLHQGPRAARVEKVDTKELSVRDDEQGFKQK